MIFTFPTIRRRHPWLFPSFLRVGMAVVVFLFVSVLTVPYLVIRGFADETSIVRSDAWILPLERLIGFGETPSERLQALLHGGGFGPFEWVCFIFYAAFFYLPMLLLPLTALFSTRRFVPLLLVYLLLLYAAGPLFVLFPTEPPWMTVDVVRVLRLWKDLPVSADTNQIAAFPSLHVGMPAAFMFWARRERLRWLFVPLLLQTAGVAFAVIYFGEHYVVDVVAGVALAYAVVRVAPQADPLPRLAAAVRGRVGVGGAGPMVRQEAEEVGSV